MVFVIFLSYIINILLIWTLYSRTQQTHMKLSWYCIHVMRFHFYESSFIPLLQYSITLQLTRLKISPGWTDGTTVKCTAALPEEQGSVPNIHAGEAHNLLALQLQGIGTSSSNTCGHCTHGHVK